MGNALADARQLFQAGKTLSGVNLRYGTGQFPQQCSGALVRLHTKTVRSLFRKNLRDLVQSPGNVFIDTRAHGVVSSWSWTSFFNTPRSVVSGGVAELAVMSSRKLSSEGASYRRFNSSKSSRRASETVFALHSRSLSPCL